MAVGSSRIEKLPFMSDTFCVFGGTGRELPDVKRGQFTTKYDPAFGVPPVAVYIVSDTRVNAETVSGSASRASRLLLEEWPLLRRPDERNAEIGTRTL